MPDVTVSACGIRKIYGPVVALQDGRFEAFSGEIHALVGENGAGKSTLIKILSGTTSPTEGTLSLFGENVVLTSPSHAQSLGIQTVFQELTLIPDLTVADNILNVREGHGLFRRTSSRVVSAQAEKLLADFGVENIDPRAVVRHMSLPNRQIVEIVKALSNRPKVVIMDEATSALLAPQVEWLFGILRKLRDEGRTIIFTSHRWDEVTNLTDRLTIFRNGAYVGTYRTSDMTEDEVTTLMSGQPIEALYPDTKPSLDFPAMQVERLSSTVLKDVTLTLHAGEILGVGGLAGQGQRELFLTLFGALPATGVTRIHQETVHLRSPRDAIKKGVGIGFVPEDRKTEGLLLNLSVLENVSLPSLRQTSRWGLLVDRRRQQDLFSEASGKLQIKYSTVRQGVGELSGGNQQKVVLAKWLAAQSKILLLYDVTRGVDIGTKRDIYRLIRDLAAQGIAILLYSSETSEVVHLAHRVVVMYEGQVRQELVGDEITEERVVGASIGLKGLSQGEEKRA